LRADGLVLRLQTPSQARRRAPPAADGGGPPPALGRTHSPPGPPARPRVAKPEEMAKLTLKRGADRRLRAGHLWVYRSEVAGLAGHWSPASPVDVVDAAGTFLGRGFYNPRPSLACRLLTRRDELIDGEFFLRRLRGAHAYRENAGLAADAYRLCWSEADGLPGLVVDRYGATSVV